jgi:hypothetical protein
VYIDPFATEVVLFLKSGVNDVSDPPRGIY